MSQETPQGKHGKAVRSDGTKVTEKGIGPRWPELHAEARGSTVRDAWGGVFLGGVHLILFLCRDA